MAKRVPRNSPNTRKHGTVGYGKPPESTRFKPGQSGNPKGRRKGVQNLETDLQQTLQAPVEIKNAKGTRTITTQQALLQTLAAKALAGDMRANQQLLNLILRSPNGNKSEAPAILLDSDDRAILDEYYYDRRAREAEQAESGSLPTARATSNAAATDRGTLQ
jgi:uncharacterized protein DUF5681